LRIFQFLKVEKLSLSKPNTSKMDKDAFEKYLEERYYDQMKYYSGASKLNQRKYRQYQWMLIILSALTPVFAALVGRSKMEIWCHPVDSYLQLLVIIISAIVAILTTGLKTFNYHELWVTYRLTNEKLKPEIYYYNFDVGPYGAAGVDKESLFVTRVETILDTEHSQWPPAKKMNDPKEDEQAEQANEQANPPAGDQPADQANAQTNAQAGDQASDQSGSDQPGGNPPDAPEPSADES
jgi:hypothetical protein